MESLAVRSNGQILVTQLTVPDIVQIDPFQQDVPPKVVATLPDTLGTLGIAELEKDVFAITKGNFSLTTGLTIPQSFSLYKADLRKEDAAVVSKIVDIPEAGILNGVTTVKKGSKFLLSADSVMGVIWRINLETAEYDIVLNDTATQPPLPPTQGGFGANGVHTRDGFLYFTNSDTGFFRVPIHEDGTPAGDVEIVADFLGGDDFTFDKDGDAYVARGRVDIISKISPADEVVSLNYTNADALVLTEGSTAVKFGRTECDRKTLYVTTNGGTTGLVNGTFPQGARVLAIDL